MILWGFMAISMMFISPPVNYVVCWNGPSEFEMFFILLTSKGHLMRSVVLTIPLFGIILLGIRKYIFNYLKT